MGRLGISTQLVTHAGPAATVVSVKTEKNKEGVKVFNFEIEGQHSYFVGKTGGGLWVHNDCKGAWIQKNLYRELQKLAGIADKGKFARALQKGIVGPVGQAGIKALNPIYNGFAYELKIMGSANRLLGNMREDGYIIFELFIKGGLH
jgi:hypothetical protein